MELDLPILGICLGHQLFALANGIKTEKLKYGHRGANQPVLDKIKERVFVTSQNHGYAVMSDSIPHWLCQVSHINVNDGSCERLIYEKKNAFKKDLVPSYRKNARRRGHQCSGMPDKSPSFSARRR